MTQPPVVELFAEVLFPDVELFADVLFAVELFDVALFAVELFDELFKFSSNSKGFDSASPQPTAKNEINKRDRNTRI